jgi:hypothetical protein
MRIRLGLNQALDLLTYRSKAGRDVAHPNSAIQIPDMER